MKLKDTGENTLIKLTYDEELECARKFCAMLDLLWIENHSTLFKPLCDLFWKKSMGHDFTMDEFANLAEKALEYNTRLDPDYAAKHGLPSLYEDMEDNDEHIEFGNVPAHTKGRKTKKDLKLQYRKEIARAWKEAWQEHPGGWCQERYPAFPGDEILNPAATANDMWEKDVKLEREFWEMVDRRQVTFGCSRREAIREVSDYIPRARFEENRLADPDPERVVNPVIDLDELMEEREAEFED